MANLVPKVNNTGSIGTNAKKWSNVHTSTLTLGAQSAPLDLNSQRITSLSDPVALADAATKNYVDAAIQGLSAKDSVRVATTSSETLTTAFANGQSIDGVTLSTGDRILVKDQASGAENGVYTVNASGAPTRAADFNSSEQVEKGAYIFVEEGTVNANAGFVLTTDGTIILGTTSLAFTQFSGAGQITAGDGIAKSGNVLSADIVGLNAITTIADADVLMIADADDSSVLKKITRSDFLSGVTSEVVDDTTPQLGGDLDTNSFKIINTATASPLELKSSVASGNSGADIQFTSDNGVIRNNSTALFMDYAVFYDSSNTSKYKSFNYNNWASAQEFSNLVGTYKETYYHGSIISTANPLYRQHFIGNRMQSSGVGDVTFGNFDFKVNALTSNTFSVSPVDSSFEFKYIAKTTDTDDTSSNATYRTVEFKNNKIVLNDALTIQPGLLELKNDASLNGDSALRIYDDGNTNYVGLLPPATFASGNYNLRLPTDDGNANQVLKTDGSGNLSWVDQASGGISNILEDVSPQLGGALDVNGQDIVSVSNGNITLTPNGTGVVRIDGSNGIDMQSGEIAVKNSGSVSNIKLYCESLVNPHYTQIQSAAHGSYTGNVTLTLPVSTGTLVGTGDSGTVTNTMLAGSIEASKMNNAIFADLETLGAPTADGEFIVATGAGAFAYESGATARTSLGLGSGDSPTFTSLTLSAQAGALAMNSQKITGLATPTADGDAATKSYVDSVAQGLSAKDSVRAATTANGTLATAFANGQTVDGVTLATGDRILIKDQTSGAENGIYTVNASGAPTRAVDFDENAEVAKGAFIFVEEGTTNADAGFVLTTDGAITLDTTSLAFTQFSGAGNVTAGDALTKSGNTLNVAVDNSSIEVNSDALRVKASGITSAMLAGSIANSKLNTLTTANKVALSALDLDGGTDIGADLVDADLIVVDDGAGGTNRKSALSRIKKYIFSSVSGDATATDSGAFTVSSSGTALTDITAGSGAATLATSGDININSTTNGADIIFNGKNNGGGALQLLKLHGQDATYGWGYCEIYGNITSQSVIPKASGFYNLGSTTNRWGNVYLSDQKSIFFGNDQEIELKHDPDDGLILKMIGSTSYDPSLVLTSDSEGVTGPKLVLRHDSASPADGDRVGMIEFAGDDSAGGYTSYGHIAGFSSAVASGSEVGKVVITPLPATSNVKGLSVEGIAGSSTKVKVNIDTHNGSDSGLHLDGTLVTASAAELNILDGVTATTAEVNLLDGATSAQATTLVDADRVIVNDAGTMKQVALSDVKTYVNAGGSSADFSSVAENILPSAANTYSLGSATAEWSDLYMGDGSRIYLGNDQDVYFEHDPDDGVQLHMASAGSLEPTFKIVHNNSSSNFQGPSLQLVNQTLDSSSDIIGSIRYYGGSTLSSYIFSSGQGGTSGTGTQLYMGVCPSGANTQTALTITGVSNTNGTIVQINDHNGSTTGLKLGGTLVTSTAAELNVLDGVTATTTELNILDGNTSAQATTLQSTDRVIVNDAGVMKQVALSDVKTYVGSGTFEAQAIELGDLLLNYSGSSTSQYLRLTMADNSSNGEPIFLIENDTTSSSGGKLAFSIKEANSNTVGDGDTLGTLEWRETASNGGASYWCYQLGKVLDHTNNYGSLEFKVRSGSTSPATALSIEGSAGGTLIDIEDHDGTDSGLKLGGTLVTSTAAELNILDGATVTASELNSLDVSAQSPSDNEVLTYTAASGLHWAAAGGGGGGASVPTITSASPSSAYTITTHSGIEEIYLLTPSTAITVNLPGASTAGSGYKYQIKNLSANTITIDPSSSETIDGSSTFDLSSQYSSVTIVSDGSNWFII